VICPVSVWAINRFAAAHSVSNEINMLLDIICPP